MFERFTKDARAVVQGAVAHAEAGGSPSVDAEHLLLAVLDREASRASFALAALGLDAHKDAVRRELHDARRRAGLSRADTDALAGLGIDVLEIISRVEAAHGAGALSAGREDSPWWSGRRPFGRDARRILEKALRMAVARRDRRIGDEHLLLALAVRPGVPCEVLADHGVTYTSLTRVLYGDTETRAAG